MAKNGKNNHIRRSDSIQDIVHSEVVNLVSGYTGYSQAITKEIIEGYIYVIGKLMEQGCSVRVPTLGKFTNLHHDAIKGGEKYMYFLGETKQVEPKQEYLLPKFLFSKTKIEKIKKATEGYQSNCGTKE